MTIPFPSLSLSVPVTIISSPQAHQTITGNVPVKLTVEFQGRATQNMVATWYRDGTPLAPSRIQTTFNNSNIGTTCLMFDAITRGDAGVYRVEVVTHQGSGTIPDQDRRAVTSFQVDVRGECCSEQVPFCDLGSIHIAFW